MQETNERPAIQNARQIQNVPLALRLLVLRIDCPPVDDVVVGGLVVETRVVTQVFLNHLLGFLAGFVTWSADIDFDLFYSSSERTNFVTVSTLF